ncbi:hypothetical protein [Mycoplasma zalophidermidis]|uniref:hypothetical protein n=1 Tax=Mycoplasma zalophidermidis TaxID=398174 RepID=UPI00215BB745|nr:hypothetical protein [Mycoplasma zalophidermidis]MCR8966442.1 hypothetical protein [Mycoplasma zalophidermidis]
MNLLESNKIKKTNEKLNLYIDGRLQNLQVYEIELDALYYNDKNDRVLTWSSTADSNELTALKENNIEAYNNKFETWIRESNVARLNSTKENIKTIGQIKPGVVLADGRIIDGNRRFTCLRMLQRENAAVPNKYKFKAAILDLNINSDNKRIKLLELNIQLGEDEKVGYSPIETMLGAYKDIVLNEIITIDEYSTAANISRAEIKKRIENAEFLCELLSFINADGQYYIARNNAWHDPILECVKILKFAKNNGLNEEEQESLKKILFMNLLTNQSGDKTRYMRQFSNVVKTPNYARELIENEHQYLDKTLDILEKHLSSDKKLEQPEDFFKELAFTNIDSELNYIVKSIVEKSSYSQEKDKPLLLIQDSIKKINEIDMDFIYLCDKETKKALQESIDILLEKTTELKLKLIKK